MADKKIMATITVSISGSQVKSLEFAVRMLREGSRLLSSREDSDGRIVRLAMKDSAWQLNNLYRACTGSEVSDA